MIKAAGPRAANRLSRFAAEMVLGAAAALGQAPFGMWLVALAALALALRRIARAEGPGDGFWRGLRIGAGYFGLALSWIVQPFFIDPWRHGWMAPFALVLIAFGLGLFWGLAGWLARRMGGREVTLALTLSLLELARGHVLTGFPWALPGHVWIDTALAQTASLAGAYGMTALTLLALAAPLSLRWKGAPVTLAILVLAGGWSAHRLSLPEPEARAAGVRLVQPNIAQSLKWDRAEAERNFDNLLSLTVGAGTDLVIWPETAVPWLVEPESSLARTIAEAGGAATVAAGIQRVEGWRAWNTLAVFGPGGSLPQTFDKVHLVPFGEYVPMGDLLYDWFGLQAFASQAGAGYTPGERRNLLDFGPALGRAVPVICYEAIFPGDLATEERGDWILQVTNDAWFGTLTGPYQHFAQTKLRAIEQGLPLLRVANTGISAILDARGRVVAGASGAEQLLPLGQRGMIDGAIPGALTSPPYARLGDGPLLAVLLLLLGLVATKLLNRANRGG